MMGQGLEQLSFYFCAPGKKRGGGGGGGNIKTFLGTSRLFRKNASNIPRPIVSSFRVIETSSGETKEEEGEECETEE